MPLLDDRGRLFGKINLIDAAVVAFVLILVPLGYVAYLLFRVPAPIVTSIAPVTFTVTKDQLVDVKGEHLRPFLRATAGTRNVEYLFADVDHAQLKLPELSPGTYDVMLYDEAQLLAKIGSISVSEPSAPAAALLPPLIGVSVLGTFGRLDASQAATLRPGMRFEWPDGGSNLNGREGVAPGGPAAPIAPIEWMEIVALQPPRPDTVSLTDDVVTGALVEGKQQVPAVVILHASLAGRDMKVQGTRIARNVELAVPVAPPPSSRPAAAAAPGGAVSKPPPLLFTVGRVYPEKTTPIDLRVRFVTRPDIVGVVQREQAAMASLPEAFRSLLPQVTTFQVTQELLGESKLEVIQGRISVADGVVRIPAVATLDGWSYQNRVLRAGADFTLDAQSYSMTGSILSITAPDGRAER